MVYYVDKEIRLLNQYPTETETTMSKEVNTLDEALKSVWDKIRLATHLISQLREEKQILSARVDELERQMTLLRSDLSMKDQELKRLRAEHSQLLNANGQQRFTEEEKENIKSKIRDLISKINSYL